MTLRRLGLDILSVASVLAVLVCLTWVLDRFGVPVARWVSGSTGTASAKAVEQGHAMARQALGLFYVGGVFLAAYSGGRFLRGRPANIRIGYFATALVLMTLLWLAGAADGLIVPTMIGGRVWPALFLFLLSLSTGWAYGSKSIGETSNAAWTAASAGTSAGDAGAYAAKHRDDISDFFN